MEQNLDFIAKAFDIDGEIISHEKISNGLINLTYDVTVSNNGKENRYIFQCINPTVFKNPVQIMENIKKITEHISAKLKAEGKSRDRVMHFLSRKDGTSYYENGEQFWRISEYVPNSIAYNSCDNLEHLCSAGKAFGEFQTMLSDFDASVLFETIPNFHNTRHRIETLMTHVKEDSIGRVCEVESEIQKIRNYRRFAERLNELLDEKFIPLRVTHNDTKINNVLFDKDTGEAKTVIDLDTVMPGLVAHDFGDAIRSAASTTSEDAENNLTVRLDVERFSAFAEGFIGSVAGSLTHTEIRTLALGAFTMALELSSRFLDDYITGDKYFTPKYEGHNLVRARTQLALAEDIYIKIPLLNSIVEEIYAKYAN